MTGFNGAAVNHGDNAPMKKKLINSLATALLLLGSTATNADIWRWTDPLGGVHYVDTETAIYVWVDETGKVWFADTPDHKDAVSVELVWHSDGDSVEEAVAEAQDKQRHETWAYVGETPEDRLKREQAEQYYCDRAKEIYDAYQKAPQLYRTNADGEREYLSEEEAAQTLAETEARVDELCNI